MFSLVSCRSDTFRRREPRSTNNQIMPQLLDATCTQENHQKTKEIPRVPRHNFLYSCSSCLQSCEFKALMAGVGALIDKDPLPHSGAQSVSRWLLWNSTEVEGGGWGSLRISRLIRRIQQARAVHTSRLNPKVTSIPNLGGVFVNKKIIGVS